MSIWPRAQTFALLAGFLGEQEEGATHSCDIYLQEFFLFVFSGLRRDMTAFIEGEEGQTYMPLELEEQLIPVLLDWMTETDMKKWNHRLRRHVKKM